MGDDMNDKTGKHDFDGGYMPGIERHNWNQTFSVGVFQWVLKVSGNGIKRSAVKVRVRGQCHDAEKVYAKAREIAAELDAGTYAGPKNVTVR